MWGIQSTFRPSGHLLQRRNEVRWRPGQEASLASPCSYLRSFGSKFAVLKKLIVTLLGLFGAPRSQRRPQQWFGDPKVIRCPPSLHPWPALIIYSGMRLTQARRSQQWFAPLTDTSPPTSLSEQKLLYVISKTCWVLIILVGLGLTQPEDFQHSWSTRYTRWWNVPYLQIPHTAIIVQWQFLNSAQKWSVTPVTKAIYFNCKRYWHNHQNLPSNHRIVHEHQFTRH